MPRGNRLSALEQAQAQALHEANLSNRAIARQLGRSRDVINRFVKDPLKFAEKKHIGRPRSLTARDERNICRVASNSSKTANQIRAEVALRTSKSTILRTIKRSGHLVSARMIPAPKLTARHKSSRVLFARQNLNRNWEKVG